MANSDAAGGGRGMPWWVSLACAMVVALGGCSGPGDEPATADRSVTITYSQWQAAAVGSVVVRVPYDGLVVPAGTVSISSSASGTITRPAVVGGSVAVGAPLVWVDERPVTAMPGDVPVYRDLLAPADGSALSGADVRQLQAFLAGAGYYSGAADGVFGYDTGSAARDWRDDHDLPYARGFSRTELLFLPGEGPWTVTKTSLTVGQAFTGGPVADISAGGLAVTVSLDGPAPADVAYAVVTAPGEDSPEIPLTPAGPATAADAGGYTQLLSVAQLPAGATLSLGSAVVVEQRQTLATDVLTIPVAAVRLDAAGRTIVICRNNDTAAGRNCPVSLGASDGTVVEVPSGLDTGTEVAVAP